MVAAFTEKPLNDQIRSQDFRSILEISFTMEHLPAHYLQVTQPQRSKLCEPQTTFSKCVATFNVLWSRDPPLLDDTSDQSCFRPLRTEYSFFLFLASHVPVSLKPHMSTEQKSPDYHSLSNPFFVLLLAHGLTPLDRSSAAETSLASTCFSHSALVLISSPLGISA